MNLEPSARPSSDPQRSAPLRSSARPPKLRVLGISLLVCAFLLATCLLLAPLSWVFVPTVASSVAGAWLLNEVRTIASFGKVAELAGEPWGIDAWVLIVLGGGVVALSALSLALAWPAAWILAGLLALLGVRVLVR